ncbi:hypothetical protein DRQ09_08670, partial [candidate division KSB1 bacterium]
MRAFLAVIGISAIIYFGYSLVRYLDRFGSVEGQVYLTDDGDVNFKLITNYPIFLVDGRIKKDIEALKAEYDSLISPIEKEYKKAKREYLEKKEAVKQDEILMKTIKFLGIKEKKDF